MNRAYRITFAHKVGKFVIEVQGFAGMYWSPAKDGNKVRHFDTYDQAVNHVKTIGLDRVYQDFTFKAPFGTLEVFGNYPSAPDRKATQHRQPNADDEAFWRPAANINFPHLNKEQA